MSNQSTTTTPTPSTTTITPSSLASTSTTNPIPTPILPPELLQHIIHQLTPPSSTIALPSNSPTTKTLYSLLFVHTSTHLCAKRLLYKHCLYIDTSTRLRLLLLSLSPPSTTPTPTSSSPSPSTILPYLQNIYLSPFPAHTIDDLPTAQWVYELCSITRATMKRVVWGIPGEDVLPRERDHLDVLPRLEKGLGEWGYFVDGGRRDGEGDGRGRLGGGTKGRSVEIVFVGGGWGSERARMRDGEEEEERETGMWMGLG